ncbi:MAG: hypothetical protein R3E95_19805 [Thiolinea sp.]
MLEDRAAMGRGEMPVDWGFGETLAYASLLEEGVDVCVCPARIVAVVPLASPCRVA